MLRCHPNGSPRSHSAATRQGASFPHLDLKVHALPPPILLWRQKPASLRSILCTEDLPLRSIHPQCALPALLLI